jgi:hypothetical protein
MQILQIDLYTIEKEWFLTVIDTFSKFLFVKNIRSRSRVDIEKPLFDILTQISIPELIVVDNEASLKSEVIRNKLEEIGISVFETPTGRSEVNGQIERLHSTITEIYRCLKMDSISSSPRTLIRLAVDKYNKTIHSVIKITPQEALFGVTELINPDPESLSQQRQELHTRTRHELVKTQNKNRTYQNEKRKTPQNYENGEKALVKNTQIISKHVNPKKVITIAENKRVTVKDSKGSKFHKTHLKQFKEND